MIQKKVPAPQRKSVKKKTNSSKPAGAAKASLAEAREKEMIAGLELPTKKSKPSTNIEDYSFLIYGQKKIGKTTLASQFNDPVFFNFENGTKSLRVYSLEIPNWLHARHYAEQLALTDHPYKTAVIDTGKICYSQCMSQVGKENGFAHPGGQNDFGASWSKVNNEFLDWNISLANGGMGTLVLAHERIKEVKGAGGREYTVVEPELSGSAMEFYHGSIDTILYYRSIRGERFVTVRGDESITAGTRCKHNFLTPSGKPIFHIPMGESEEEAYENLVKAFNNKQKKTYAELNSYPPEAKKKKPFKK